MAFRLEEWTDVEFERITGRLLAYKNDPGSLSPEVFGKCQALYAEINKDSKRIQFILSKGLDLRALDATNLVRQEIVEWLAKSP